jgi:hypothetical protein
MCAHVMPDQERLGERRTAVRSGRDDRESAADPKTDRRPVSCAEVLFWTSSVLLAALTGRRTLRGRPSALPAVACAVPAIGWRLRIGKSWCCSPQGESAGNGQCENKTSHRAIPSRHPLKPALKGYGKLPPCRGATKSRLVVVEHPQLWAGSAATAAATACASPLPNDLDGLFGDGFAALLASLHGLKLRAGRTGGPDTDRCSYVLSRVGSAVRADQ